MSISWVVAARNFPKIIARANYDATVWPTFPTRAVMEATGAHSYEPAVLDGVVLDPVQAHVLFRHGDRSPVPLARPGPAGCRDDAEVWAARLQQASVHMPEFDSYHLQEYPWGSLTQRGARQAREVGKWLRLNYVNSPCLSDEDLASALVVRTTGYMRTHMTAWYVLEGLAASSTAPGAIPIETLHDIHIYDHCPELKALWGRKWMSLHTTGELDLKGNLKLKEDSWQARSEGLRKALRLHLGLPDHAPFPWLTAVDIVHCAKCHGDALPAGVTLSDVDQAVQELAKDNVASLQDKDICQLAMGGLLRSITGAMAKYRDESATTPSFFLYSGHDASIVPLSVCLGSPWKNWPEYASFLLLELLKAPNGDELYVRALYNGREEALSVFQLGEPVPPTGPVKKSIFTLEQFLEQVQWCTEERRVLQEVCS